LTGPVDAAAALRDDTLEATVADRLEERRPVVEGVGDEAERRGRSIASRTARRSRQGLQVRSWPSTRRTSKTTNVATIEASPYSTLATMLGK
jgi:hypothetical protein